ncbi:A/G-specific adenine glycosylase [Paenibacillus sp. SAFN-117]|uniref:A/G-specific adenine glycosylase n=1 Tax=Paenibacillus sp. SAFN-117 TaxID=3436860 RepID=UPI003F7F3C13
MHNNTMQELETRRYFAAGLLEWYDRNKRDLPWRRTSDPYHIWVSEVMLQQTRVDTVIPYYFRFLERFPDVEALAHAPEEEVLKAWEGLGYYSRARNLQSAVREVHERYGGTVPDRKEDFSSLKGVGPYTAGAVLSIAYNVPEPAVDGNVMRVLSRFFLIEDDIAKGPTRVKMEKLARELIPEGEAGSFNQALMELGATVCTPRSPHCLTCPVMERCRGRLEGKAEELPVKTKAKPPRIEARAVALIEGSGPHAGKLLIRRRPRQGLLANMWELPHIEIERPAGKAAAAQQGAEMEALGAGLAETDGVTVLPERWLMDAEHIFSHIRWELAVYRCRLDPRFEAAGLPPHYRWLDAGEMERYAFPNVFLRILAEVGIEQA